MDAETLKALDSISGLSLAILEKLTGKMLPGSYLTILSKKEAEEVMARSIEIAEQFRDERRKKATGLVLPPGART